MEAKKDMQVIEINGIKMEIDMRTAKRVDEFRIGCRVKVLVKEYSDTRVYPGVIVGFENFKSLPTIIVAYLSGYHGELKFLHINANSEDVDMVLGDEDYFPIEKSDIVDKMEREIEKKKMELKELEQKKEYFLTRFDSYFKLDDMKKVEEDL
jgi:hypothetical protein